MANQPARSFNFGAAPQASNRGFPQRPAGNACYACGLVGHLQRDCPRTRAASQPAQPKKVAPSKADACGVLAEDSRDASSWPFTCYAPAFTLSSGGNSLVAGPCLVSGDLAFEEARSIVYAASASGPAATAHAVRSESEHAVRRQSEMRALLGFSRQQLQQALTDADAGRSLPGSLPPLPWLTGQPVPVQSPRPPALGLPQPPALSLFPTSSSVGLATAPQAVAPPLVPGSEEDAWQAPSFSSGHIPETPPPPNMC